MFRSSSRSATLLPLSSLSLSKLLLCVKYSSEIGGLEGKARIHRFTIQKSCYALLEYHLGTTQVSHGYQTSITAVLVKGKCRMNSLRRLGSICCEVHARFAWLRNIHMLDASYASLVSCSPAHDTDQDFELLEAKMDIKCGGLRNFLITALIVTLRGFPYLLLCYESASVGHLQSLFHNFTTILGGQEDPKLSIQHTVNDLEEVLAKAALANKTVIITTLNEAWAANDTMLDLYLESFHRGEKIEYLLNHMVLVTLDEKAHEKCLQVHPHCFRLTTSGVDFAAEKHFMSEDYLDMMWRRIKFLGDVLELGYSFVFSDADILWFRDPFARFFDNVDFQIACDRYYGNSFNDSGNEPNGGFVYVRSNERTIAMYKYWYEARVRIPGKHDQAVLNVILREEDFDAVGVKIRFLDTAYFSTFCQKSRRDMAKVVTMHANCCLGLKNKLKDLRLALDDWSLYKNSDAFLDEKKAADPSHNLPWRLPLACMSSMRDFKGN